MQEAAIRALRQWPVTGVLDSPRAWLTVTARRAAIDALRRETVRTTKERAAVNLDVTAEEPDDVVPSPMAVLSLLLLTEARRPARTDADGNPVVLADQDRAAWDAQAIDEGRRLLDTSLRRTAGIADPYQLQAAIAAQHSTAPSYRDTDWAEIVRLYDLLLEVYPSPAAMLARAVAVAERSGATAGLASLASVDSKVRDHRWHAVHGELLARNGRFAEAIDEVTMSLTDVVSAPEAAHRRRQIDQWRRQAS